MTPLPSKLRDVSFIFFGMVVQQKDNLCNNCSLYVAVKRNTECTSIFGMAAMLLLLIVQKKIFMKI